MGKTSVHRTVRCLLKQKSFSQIYTAQWPSNSNCWR